MRANWPLLRGVTHQEGVVGGERWVVEAPVGQVVVGGVSVPLLQRQVQRDFLPEYSGLVTETLVIWFTFFTTFGVLAVLYHIYDKC